MTKTDLTDKQIMVLEILENAVYNKKYRKMGSLVGAFEFMQTGARYSARIFELRGMGFNIVKIKGKNGMYDWLYYLKEYPLCWESRKLIEGKQGEIFASVQQA